MNATSRSDQFCVTHSLGFDLSGYQDASLLLDALMSREELCHLTGTMQPKRMCAWLEARAWAHEPPARRGDIPKVLRAYRDARLSGLQPERTKKASYAFMTAGLL